MAGKGAAVVEHLIQVFFKYLDKEAVDSKQVHWDLFAFTSWRCLSTNYKLIIVCALSKGCHLEVMLLLCYYFSFFLLGRRGHYSWGQVGAFWTSLTLCYVFGQAY